MERKIEKYLQIIRKVHKCNRIYDMHVHPLDVFFNVAEYKEDQHVKGLFSQGERHYSKPTLKILKELFMRGDMHSSHNLNSRLIQCFLRKIYLHTGPYVFRSIFDISEIDKGLLLPVASENVPIDEQMELVFRMYSGDKRFYLAGSVPNTISNENVERFLEKQRDRYSIVAVKIHPNITGINLGDPEGKERIECVIRACSRLILPVVIHSGKTHDVSGKSFNFAEIKYFKDINLSSAAPVILAHGGAYGVPSSEIRDGIIPVLKELLNMNQNLCIDISGLTCDAIYILLSNIEIGKILFGSDALYENPFVMEMRLVSALDSTNLNIEQSLVKIMSENIEDIFGWRSAKQ